MKKKKKTWTTTKETTRWTQSRKRKGIQKGTNRGATEIEFMRRTASYTCLGYKNKLYVMKKLNTWTVMESTENYRSN
jgi:hypothetical protein